MGLSLPQHDHHSHPATHQEGGWWWGDRGGERVEYLEAEGDEALVHRREEGQVGDLGEIYGMNPEGRGERGENSLTERRSRRISADSISSDVPLLSSSSSPSSTASTPTFLPPNRTSTPSHVWNGRRRGRAHLRQGGRRELSNVVSVGSEGEEEVWEDTREGRDSWSGERDWRGKVEVGMGR